MIDFYPHTRKCIDRFNDVMETIMTSATETDEDEDEFLQNFCIHLAHALIKDTGYGGASREELGKTANIIKDVLR